MPTAQQPLSAAPNDNQPAPATTAPPAPSASSLPPPASPTANAVEPVADAPLHVELQALAQSVAQVQLPPELRTKLDSLIHRLNRSLGQPGYFHSYEETVSYIEWVLATPWFARNQDTLDLRYAQTVLNQHHYGLIPIKQRILEHLAVLIRQSQASQQISMSRSPVLCFVGLPGIGKTSIASSVAASLNRPFIRIPMGGMGSAQQLRGQSRGLPSAEPGQVIKALRRVQVRNPVILLDEIDRTAENGRGELMGVLLELLDPEQNSSFVDNFIDYPFDLSEALFIASANNTGGIANAVLDRLEVIQMPGYSDQEKVHIARDYLFPRQLQAANIPPQAVIIEDDVWQDIVRPLGFDAGIRTMERVINGLVRKVALQMVTGQAQQFYITSQNVRQFLPDW